MIYVTSQIDLCSYRSMSRDRAVCLTGGSSLRAMVGTLRPGQPSGCPSRLGFVRKDAALANRWDFECDNVSAATAAQRLRRAEEWKKRSLAVGVGFDCDFDSALHCLNRI